MHAVLANRTYRPLLAAKVIALVGTGHATVALALLAYELAGANAGAAHGTVLAIKMLAYIGIGPIVGPMPAAFHAARFGRDRPVTCRGF